MVRDVYYVIVFIKSKATQPYNMEGEGVRERYCPNNSQESSRLTTQRKAGSNTNVSLLTTFGYPTALHSPIT